MTSLLKHPLVVIALAIAVLYYGAMVFLLPPDYDRLQPKKPAAATSAPASPASPPAQKAAPSRAPAAASTGTAAGVTPISAPPATVAPAPAAASAKPAAPAPQAAPAPVPAAGAPVTAAPPGYAYDPFSDNPRVPVFVLPAPGVTPPQTFTPEGRAAMEKFRVAVAGDPVGFARRNGLLPEEVEAMLAGMKPIPPLLLNLPPPR